MDDFQGSLRRVRPSFGCIMNSSVAVCLVWITSTVPTHRWSSLVRTLNGQIGASLLPGCKWASVVGLGKLKFWCGYVEEGSICGKGVRRKWEGWREGKGLSNLCLDLYMVFTKVFIICGSCGLVDK